MMPLPNEKCLLPIWSMDIGLLCGVVFERMTPGNT